MKCSLGTMRYANGDAYEGEWAEDVKCGDGCMTWRSSQQEYRGQWARNMPNGIGTQVGAWGNHALMHSGRGNHALMLGCCIRHSRGSLHSCTRVLDRWVLKPDRTLLRQFLNPVPPPYADLVSAGGCGAQHRQPCAAAHVQQVRAGQGVCRRGRNGPEHSAPRRCCSCLRGGSDA